MKPIDIIIDHFHAQNKLNFGIKSELWDQK
jgi:hypothetical protein